MNWFKRLFMNEKETDLRADPTNYDYVCIPQDPINTVNYLREGEWNMGKVQESMAMGMLRYATESEVKQAKEAGRLK